MQWYRVNILRPHPDLMFDNADICRYIEPLREKGDVITTPAYMQNLFNYSHRRFPTCDPNFDYFFWFKSREEAGKLQERFPHLVVTRDWFKKKQAPWVKEWVEEHLSRITPVPYADWDNKQFKTGTKPAQNFPLRFGMTSYHQFTHHHPDKDKKWLSRRDS